MTDRADSTHARKTVNARMGFFIHLTAFLVVNALLVFINLTTSPGRLWFYWPLLGWGIGIIAHAVATFWLPGVRNRMIEREIGKRDPQD